MSEVSQRVGLKWNYFGDDVLAVWVAEMDFGLAPSVSRALHEAVDRGDTGYPYPALEEAAAVAATGFWGDRLGWQVSPDHVFAAPDVVEGSRRAIVHLTRPGSEVIIPSPAYFPFFSMVERAGRRISEVPCQPDGEGRYTLDLEAIDTAFSSGAGSIVLCNPWNPTGRSLTVDELETLLAIVKAHDGRIISDEIHAALAYQGVTHRAIASIDPETVITVTSASKAWNLPGLKCAQVVLTNPGDRTIWNAYFTPEKVAVGTFGLIANAAAYSGGREWLDGVMGRLASNRELLTELISTQLPDVGYRAPEATYLAWLDFTRRDLNDPAAHFLDSCGVALTAGGPFGSGGAGHCRFNFATTEDVMIEAVEKMAASI